jgi:zinc D-Ala-D-Ala carboxypeptidase
MSLTPNFPLALLVRSETAEQEGIDNSPPAEVIDNLRLLAAGLEQVQSLLGHPLQISSGFRCHALNQAVGGSSTSQHVQGLAADFICPEFGPPLEIARAICASAIAFDQCILEYARWVHISFSPQPRGRMLTIYDGSQGYIAGLWDSTGNRVV